MTKKWECRSIRFSHNVVAETLVNGNTISCRAFIMLYKLIYKLIILPPFLFPGNTVKYYPTKILENHYHVIITQQNTNIVTAYLQLDMPCQQVYRQLLMLVCKGKVPRPSMLRLNLITTTK